MASDAPLPPGYDEEAMERCKAIFWDLIEDPSKVKLTITSEFRGTVRELTEDKEYAAKYEQNRPQVFTLAKAIPISGGIQHVVVLQDPRPYGPPEATFEHEALHVQIAQRGESLFDLRLRLAAEGLEIRGDLVAMADIACEEYRGSSASSPLPATRAASSTAPASRRPPAAATAKPRRASAATPKTGTCCNSRRPCSAASAPSPPHPHPPTSPPSSPPKGRCPTSPSPRRSRPWSWVTPGAASSPL
jgi:hypothetical protein